MRAEQHLLDRLRVHLNARHCRIEWRGAQVEQSRRTGANQHDAPLDLGSIDLAVQQVSGRNEPSPVTRREMHPDLALGVGRHLNGTDAHGDNARAGPKRLLTAGAR